MQRRQMALLSLVCAAGLLASCVPLPNTANGGTPAAQSAAPVNTETVDAAATPTPSAAQYPDMLFEAENAQRTGLDLYATPSGGQSVGVWESTGNRLTFAVEVPAAGWYALDFLTAGEFGESQNTLVVNETALEGILKTQSDAYETGTVLVRLQAGQNEISVERGDGYIYIDSMTVRSVTGLDDSVYRVGYALNNPNASDHTVRLFQYLQSIYGSYTLSGQYASDKGVNSPEVKALYQLTGKYPAIVGIDLMDYSPSRVERGAQTNATDYALEWARQGGILTLIWHWNAPKDLIDTDAQPWWDGYNTSATTFDLGAALNGNDPEGYRLLLRDIDAIAIQLKRLADADVPVLWRPLHEASGGWFWWGASGADNYKKLWKLMYSRLTNVHHLNNLIWVYNGQAANWYPGDEYVDIIAEDEYVDPFDYESLYNLFYKALLYTDAKKMIGLAENGAVPDPDLLVQDNARWLFFITWSDRFVVNPRSGRLSNQYNDRQHFIDVYNSDTILTLDELPQW